MIHKLLATSKCIGVLAITFVTANPVLANSTEYVFSAPPEVDNELTDIPQSETDYPLYECNTEQIPAEEKAQAEETEQVEENVIDSHNCDCIDCENATQNNLEQN
ncbi:hypothetical protein [Pleurocapsa sp. PCC 7319]|uniref:hypothetical protein n=1 Tax=Pleurocapsa sp. PCC 7319 TaxID=118161 RepID=UPI0003742C3B|nr:hypothetical protein [Pleurocapsa sp. PCC 7319]